MVPVSNNNYWVQSFEYLNFVIIIHILFWKFLYDKHIPNVLSTCCILIQTLTFLWHGSMHCIVMTVLIIHILMSRFVCTKAFSFLWDQFHVVDFPLLVISPFLAEYILQSIEKFRKTWGQPGFCRQIKINNRKFGIGKWQLRKQATSWQGFFGPPLKRLVSSCKICNQHYFRYHHPLTVETIPCADNCRSCHVKFHLLITTSYYELDHSASVLSRQVFSSTVFATISTLCD